MILTSNSSCGSKTRKKLILLNCKPKPPERLRVISLCSGGGLFDWALRDAGLDIKIQVENAHPQWEILKENFPEAEQHENIFDFHRKDVIKYGIDPENTALVGGICCQPFSGDGPQKGSLKETWMCDVVPEIVGELKPRYVVVENVKDFIGHSEGLTYLQNKLDKIGYEGRALCFPASIFGAPHPRQRVFVLYVRDKKLFDAAGFGRAFFERRADDFFAPCRENFWHGRSLSNPGICRVAYGNFSRTEKKYYEKCLEIFGNGVVYDQGYFIGKTLKFIDEYAYGTAA